MAHLYVQIKYDCESGQVCREKGETERDIRFAASAAVPTDRLFNLRQNYSAESDNARDMI